MECVLTTTFNLLSTHFSAICPTGSVCMHVTWTWYWEGQVVFTRLILATWIVLETRLILETRLLLVQNTENPRLVFETRLLLARIW